jgi:hypothetical protein
MIKKLTGAINFCIPGHQWLTHVILATWEADVETDTV